MTCSTRRRGTRLGNEKVAFQFDGQTFEGFEGDTAASALLANGIRLFGRSVKYRRRRGLLAAGSEEPNALLTVGTSPELIPNAAATRIIIRDGLKLHSQNRWPSLEIDVASVLRLGSGFFGAGFYYKTFMWPSWRSYERIIRNLAGLGSAPTASNLAPAGHEHVSCDVLVAGGGPAGLTAALAAARAGAYVVLCESDAWCGGELEFETSNVNGRAGMQWVDETVQELIERKSRILLETTVICNDGSNIVAHREPGGLPGTDVLYHIAAHASVNATGATERPIAFVNNDLPGVMLLGAAERYLACYGVAVGRRLVLFGNNDRLYPSALRLTAGGMEIAAIVDTRHHCSAPEKPKLESAGVTCLLGHAVVSAAGRREVQNATVASLSDVSRRREFVCDAVLVSGGWTSSTDSTSLEPASNGNWHALCGAAAGIFSLPEIVTSAARIGGHAARSTATPTVQISACGDTEPDVVPFWRSPASRTEEKSQFVDLQNDVTVADLRQALTEGFVDIEHVKRYTTLGIGTEQGRTGGMLGAAIVAELRGVDSQHVRPSKPRQPYRPVSLSALSTWRTGGSLRPERHTPLHAWHIANNAAFQMAGLWLRPQYYRANGESAAEAGPIEAARVRKTGGIVDSSTLGKILVSGVDAAAFLDRLYLSRASTLKSGRAKYAVLLREDGMVLDDGLMLRVGENQFLLTTSTTHAGSILSHLEFWRDLEWGDAGVSLIDVTDAWGVIVAAGPQSRDKLIGVLGAEWQDRISGMAHMDFLSSDWRGHDLRVLRASFSGELAFEIHCRPTTANELWQTLAEAGLYPYGLEALDILRIEKGYLTGAELNGQTTPNDLGMNRMVALNPHCVGSDLLNRRGLNDQSRPRLVGLRSANTGARFLAGAQITASNYLERAIGHVTSSAYSPALQTWIGLALVARSVPPEGTELVARDPLHDCDTVVQLAPVTQFDPSGERMKL